MTRAVQDVVHTKARFTHVKQGQTWAIGSHGEICEASARQWKPFPFLALALHVWTALARSDCAFWLQSSFVLFFRCWLEHWRFTQRLMSEPQKPQENSPTSIVRKCHEAPTDRLKIITQICSGVIVIFFSFRHALPKRMARLQCHDPCNRTLSDGAVTDQK